MTAAEIVQVVAQVPALGVVVYLVIYFLRANKERDESHEKAQVERDRKFLDHLERRDATLRDIGNDCHAVQRESIEAMKQTNRVIGESNEVIRTAVKAIDRLEENERQRSNQR